MKAECAYQDIDVSTLTDRQREILAPGSYLQLVREVADEQLCGFRIFADDETSLIVTKGNNGAVWDYDPATGLLRYQEGPDETGTGRTRRVWLYDQSRIQTQQDSLCIPLTILNFSDNVFDVKSIQNGVMVCGNSCRMPLTDTVPNDQTNFQEIVRAQTIAEQSRKRFSR